MWGPDVKLYNSASYDKHAESYSRKYVLRKDGVVIDVLPMMVKSTCKIDVTWFPFDEQKCLLVFGSWTLSSKYLRLEINEDLALENEFVS